MKLSEKEEEQFNELAKDIIANPKFLEMKSFVQHGSVSTYDHVISVSKKAFYLNRRWHWNADERLLVLACLLHDFYGYDWHYAQVRGVPLFKMHGFSHPYTACENAIREFGIKPEVQASIKSHMWPLNFFDFPKNKIAWLLCIADKTCAMNETLFKR